MKLLTMPNSNARRNVNVAGSQQSAQSGAEVVPQIWATEGNLALAVMAMQAEAQDASASPASLPSTRPALRVVITPETAFYRKYTEAMLRRYTVMSLQKGRVPSLLGRELFRGKVSSHRMHGFDDMIHYVIDVEGCLKLLQPDQQKVVYRVAVQEYTFPEAAELLQWSLRSTQRRYHEALDELTAIFQKRELMEKTPGLPPAKSCQEGEEEGVAVTYSSN